MPSVPSYRCAVWQMRRSFCWFGRLAAHVVRIGGPQHLPPICCSLATSSSLAAHSCLASSGSFAAACADPGNSAILKAPGLLPSGEEGRELDPIGGWARPRREAYRRLTGLHAVQIWHALPLELL